MSPAAKVFAFFAFAFLIGAGAAAHAEEEPGFPVQHQIEARQIHPTHNLMLRNCETMTAAVNPAAAQETVAPPVLFATASTKLTPADVGAIKKVAATLKSPSYRGRHVLVSGYTDNKGKDAANQRLSYHRAVMVVKELVKDGVPASTLTAQGFGQENPAASNDTAAGRAQNRRVTFTLADAPRRNKQW